MSLKATLTTKLTAVQSSSGAYKGRFTPSLEKIQVFSNGTSANQADLIYADERTVGDGANDDIDLSGVLTDTFGSTITAAEVVGLLIINQQADGTANTTDLTIGAGSNPFLGFLGGTTPTVGPLKPGASFMLFAGDAAGIGTVTAGTGDILRVANSAGAAATYQIAIVARSV